MNTRVIAAAAILLILGLSGYMLLERSSRDRAMPAAAGSESRPSNEKLAELQRQVEWLTLAQRAGQEQKDVLASAATQLDPRKTATAGASEPMASAAPAVADDPDAFEALAAEEIERQKERRERLKARLEHEARDSVWAPAIERSIAAKVTEREATVGAKLIEARCASTLCRVVLSLPSDAEQQVALDVLQQPALPRATFHFYEEAGQPRLVAHMARAGYRLDEPSP